MIAAASKPPPKPLAECQFCLTPISVIWIVESPVIGEVELCRKCWLEWASKIQSDATDAK